MIRTDLFFESFLKFIKTNPFNVFPFLCWLLQGRSIAKERLAERVEIDASLLPYETELVDYLAEQKKQGRRIVLATASHRRYAEQVALHLELFDHVIATEAGDNQKGRRKLATIRALAGEAGFCYAGDSAADRPIWQAAESLIFVNAPAADVTAAETAKNVELTIRTRPPQWRAFRREMRLHQYAKNALIFVPLFTSHSYLSAPGIVAALVAFVCFSLCASGVYFLNDLLDLQADRQHPRKRNRPLASGNLALSTGIAGAIALPLIAFALAFAFLPMLFVAVLASYYLATNAYSFFLKSISTADVMTLVIFYTLRVVAGAVATGIELSSWLLAFSFFLFVSLAYLKRYIEVAAPENRETKAHGRGYSAADSETMFSLGIANMTASVLVLALYINSAEVAGLYQSPKFLWLLCFLMLYWGNRLWVGARRGKIEDDPVVCALKDKVSRIVALSFILVALAAKFIDV